jgi:chitodextrinase
MKNTIRGMVVCGSVSLGVTVPTFADELPITAVVASADDGHVPGNTLDNNLDTRWSAFGEGQWIRYDLGSPKTIEALSIAFYRGTERQAHFDLQVSNDRAAWTPVLSGASSGTTLAPQRFDFTPVQARYVRYLGHGNTSNMWNSLTEVDVLGPAAAPPPAPTGLTTTPGDQRVALGWNTVTGAASYTLYRDDTLLASPATAGFTDTGLVNGTAYTYQVSAVNDFGEGPRSAAVTATPAPVTATAYGWAHNGNELSNANRAAAAGLTDGNTTIDVNLSGGTAESALRFEAGGILFSAAQTVTAVRFVNGTWASTGDGAFCSSLKLQVTSDGTTWTNSNWTATPPYAYDSALSSGVTYTFGGLALTARGIRLSGALHCTTNSSYWANIREITVTTAPVDDTTPPTAPSNLVATAVSAHQVDLSWSASSDDVGVAKYRVFRETTPPIPIAEATTTGYSDRTVAADTTYTYFIQALDAAGNVSAPSGAVSVTTPPPTVPAAPTGIAATAGDAQVALSWNAVSGATGYRVHRDNASIASASTTSYTDTGLTNGTTYSYQVSAVNSVGEGPKSAPVTATPNASVMRSSVSQFGITWTFDSPHQTGQFANSDWWVLGPVTIASVSPAPTSDRHGSVVNPQVHAGQGYDGRGGDFNSSVRASFPLPLPGVSSLVSSVSSPGTNCAITASEQGYLNYAGLCQRSPIKTQAILTVVGSVPVPGSFRPPYAGSGFKPFFSSASINWSLLPKLPKPASAPTDSAVLRDVERPWVDHMTVWTLQYGCATDNMYCYGREIASTVSDLANYVLLDTPVQRDLAIRLIQLGIDNYGVVISGPNWGEECPRGGCGGHMNGRKWPVVFAGFMLNDAGMRSPGPISAEDRQNYHGVNGMPLWGAACTSNYFPSCSGGGAKDCRDPAGLVDGCPDYQEISSRTWPGQALSARLLGLKAAWGYNAFFDYADRWMSGDIPSVGTGGNSAFVDDMWRTYRATLP